MLGDNLSFMGGSLAHGIRDCERRRHWQQINCFAYRNGFLEVPHLGRDVLPKIKASIVALPQECRSANSSLILSTFAMGINKLLGQASGILDRYRLFKLR